MSLSKADVALMLENKEDILDEVDNIMNGMPLDIRAVELLDNLRVSFDDRFNTVSIRYWYENEAKLMKPTNKGVSVSPDEMNAILDVLPDLLPHMVDL